MNTALIDNAQAFWLGDETPVLAWYHAPQGAMRSNAIVFCPTFGHEYMVSYRAMRKLAIRLAAAGFPVVRLDYAGTGDAFDAPQQAYALDLWRQNIRDAIVFVKERTGLTQVSLLGLRLGALIAADIARELDVASLVLIAPAMNGRMFVRELQSLHMIKAKENLAPEKMDNDEAIGYHLPAELREHMSSLDLTKMNGLRTSQVLVLTRDDGLGHEAKVIKNLEAQGLAVERYDGEGYAKLMSFDSALSEVPTRMWEKVVDWFDLHYPGTVQALESKTELRQAAAAEQFVERIRIINGMVALVTSPQEGVRKERPVLVMSNVGANHRAANHRLYVRIARHLAAHGFTVVRFDKRGLGDSPAQAPELDNQIYAVEGIDDTIRIMDAIEAEFGTEKFMLAGICSGAYFAYKVANKDPRVQGVSLINILTFDWQPGDSVEVARSQSIHSTNYYWKAAFEWATWKKLFQGKVHLRVIARELWPRIKGKVKAGFAALGERLLGTSPELTPPAQALIGLLERKIHVHGVFDSSDAGIDLWEKHLGAHKHRLARSPYYQIDVVDGSDHTFTPRWSQEWILEVLLRHYLKNHA